MADTDNTIQYPDVRRGTDCMREYTNGSGETVSIEEPYDWLEDADGEETSNWVKEQVDMFNSYIENSPIVDQTRTKMTEMLNFERYTMPWQVGKNYFYRYNTGLQNHAVLYTMDALDGEPRVLIDPNTLSEDATTSLSSNFLSEDGTLNCYSLSKGGSDWKTLHLMSVESGEKLADVLEYCKFTSVAWLHDNSGFFYTRYDAPSVDDLGTETDANENQKIYFHKIGDQQDADVFLCAAEDLGNKQFMFGVEVSTDGMYLITTVSESCARKNKLYVSSLAGFAVDDVIGSFGGDFKGSWNKVIDNMDAEYEYLGNDDNLFYCKTNLDAPNNRVVTIDVDTKEMSELVSEDDFPLNSATIVYGDYMILNYLRHVKSKLSVVKLDGSADETFKFDFEASDLSVSGSRKNSQIFIYETSFLTPGKIHHMDMAEENPALSVFKACTVPGYNPDDFSSKQVFYTSKDGTEIPMFILTPNGADLNGQMPTLLYGYGGFNISITPGFSVSRLLWCQMFNGAYCIANIRGGDEYGESWHQQGILDRKQNVFDDFISAGEYLISENYTSTERLVIEGGSNGGLLVGACCNQRPDLFACGLAHVGVMDMLRFNKFTIGYAWTSDYGDPDKSEEFDALRAYSPLHNIPDMGEGHQYPSFLGLTADHDDRVVPLHTMKFMATLQHKVGKLSWQRNPLLTRIEVKAGHGAGTSLEKSIMQRAQIFGFVSKALRLCQ